ncbi:MAG: putative heme transporter [Acidimicrobiaceae bacterium]
MTVDGEAIERAEASARARRTSFRTALLVGTGLVSLWFLRSSLSEVYSEIGEIRSVDVRWLIVIVMAEAVTFVATWELNRLALRTDRWFDVAVAQLAGNAANNVVPAGGPVGAAVQLRVLTEAGFDLTSAATSLGALSILGAAGLLCLPVIALPLTIAGEGDRALEPALWLGVGLLVAVLAVGVTFLRQDAPLVRLAAAVQWLRNRVRPARRKRTDLPARVLRERDAIRSEFRDRPLAVALAAVAKPGGDCLALYLCLVAVGAHPNPVAVLAAFAAANVAGMVPFTPGGLGFVEASITATLSATGISPEHALLAAAIYRVASTWLPVAAGFVAYLVFRVRHRAHPAEGNGRTGARRFVVPLVTGLALLLVSPVLVRVYRRVPEVVTLGPGWLLAIGLMIVLHFITAWILYRIVLRTSDWFDIAASQLASNAVSHVAPAGSAVGAGMQLRMLTVAGYPATRAAAALGATTVLGTITGYVVLPLVVLIASVLGSAVDPRLLGAMWFGAAVLAAMLVAALVLFFRDEPWRWAARVATSVQRRMKRPGNAEELAQRLIEERDFMRSVVRARAVLVTFLVFAQPLADFAALYFALRAVGAHVSPAAVLAAFIVSNVAGLIPFTPGGLGFVEAGLTGVLVVAGAARPEARLAVVTYRLAATWIPCIAGFIALALFHRRHRNVPIRNFTRPASVLEREAEVVGGHPP